MENLMMSFISVILFCLCCRQLMRSFLSPIPILATDRPYARPAMQVGKFYKTLAWGVMTMSFLIGLVISFQQVFTTL
jgi:hypothetical protein